MRQIIIILLHLPHTDCVTGGLGDETPSTDILEYTHGDGWSKIGTMRDARYDHGTSVVEFKDFERYCD